MKDVVKENYKLMFGGCLERMKEIPDGSVDTEWYKNYLLKFYNDIQFNSIYEMWVNSNFEPYKKPSLDHIVPKAKGGTNDLSNLQFLSWFENRCKNDMTQKEWNILKVNIKEYFINE